MKSHEEQHQPADWVSAAADYAAMWIDFQMRQMGQPGCSIAIRHGEEVVLERAFGVADLTSGDVLTPRHRFRVGSLSKTFTAVGILKLQEAGKLDIREPVGKHISGLHPEIALAQIGQLLSHSSGISRDSSNASYFSNMIPFPSRERVAQELVKPPTIPAGERVKYSNYAYALLGILIEATTGEDYTSWIARNVVEPAGLKDTTPDMPSSAVPFAFGHSSRLPLGKRVVIPGDNTTDAFACVTGFVSTASDMARFYAQLSPNAASGLLSAATRRAMVQGRFPDVDSALGGFFGLGVQTGQLGEWAYFGHVGRFQGNFARVAVAPVYNIALVVLTNAIDGPAIPWVDGLLRIFERFQRAGAPTGFAMDWTWRGWNIFGVCDFVGLGERVCAFNPAILPPFFEASEISLSDEDHGIVERSPAVERFGEGVRRIRGEDGSIAAIRIGGTGYVDERTLETSLLERQSRSASDDTKSSS